MDWVVVVMVCVVGEFLMGVAVGWYIRRAIELWKNEQYKKEIEELLKELNEGEN